MGRLTWTSLSNDGPIPGGHIVRWSTPWVSQSHFNSGTSLSVYDQGFGQQINSHIPSQLYCYKRFRRSTRRYATCDAVVSHMLRLIYRRSVRRSSVRRRLLISSSVRLPFLADGWPFVGASSRRHVVDGRICLRSHRKFHLLTVAPLSGPPSSSFVASCSHNAAQSLNNSSVPTTQQHTYILFILCTIRSLCMFILLFSLLLYNFDELSRITQYIYWRRTSAIPFPLTLVNISSGLHSNPCNICYSCYYCSAILVKNTHLDTLSFNVFYHL